MSCPFPNNSEIAQMRRKLAALEKKLADQNGQKPNKGSGKGARRGGGKRNATKSDGWQCKFCDFYNFGYRPVCFKCKETKEPKGEGPGVPAQNAKPPVSLVGDPKKHIAAAKDSPALQKQLQNTLHAVQQQQQETLPLHSRRASLLAQARSLADKMDQQAKLAQAATVKREELREEPVTVYLALEKLPAEPFLFALMAYTRQRAQEGDQEAQTICEQVALAREMDRLDEELDGNGEPANEN
eukprot:5839667-Amphidinium_carterae.1